MVRTTEVWQPPEGLPPGRLVMPNLAFPDGTSGAQPSLWMTDDPVVDPGPLWARLLRQHPHTRLWPLLLLTLRPYGAALARLQAQGTLGELRIQRGARRPWHSGEFEPAPAESVDAQDAAEILARWWNQVTSADSEGRHRDPSWQPFERWPGLAPTVSADPGLSAAERDAAADEFAADLIAAPGAVAELTGRDSGVHVGLVRADDGAAALAACGFISRRGGTAEDAAVIRSWQDRFGARLCAVGFDCLALSVARPPVSAEHCFRVGAEHLAYETREALIEGIDTPITFEQYSAKLSGSHTWWFWWD